MDNARIGRDAQKVFSFGYDHFRTDRPKACAGFFGAVILVTGGLAGRVAQNPHERRKRVGVDFRVGSAEDRDGRDLESPCGVHEPGVAGYEEVASPDQRGSLEEGCPSRGEDRLFLHPPVYVERFFAVVGTAEYDCLCAVETGEMVADVGKKFRRPGFRCPVDSGIQTDKEIGRCDRSPFEEFLRELEVVIADPGFHRREGAIDAEALKEEFVAYKVRHPVEIADYGGAPSRKCKKADQPGTFVRMEVDKKIEAPRKQFEDEVKPLSLV